MNMIATMIFLCLYTDASFSTYAEASSTFSTTSSWGQKIQRMKMESKSFTPKLEPND